MLKILLYVFVGLVLGAGLVFGIKHWWGPPPGGNSPRPNKKKNKANQIVIPVAAAVIIGLLAWAGLSLMLSPEKPEPENVSTSVSRPLDSSSGADASGGMAETNLGSSEAATPPAGSLVADTPLAKAALASVPVESPLRHVGMQATGSVVAVRTAAASNTTAAAPATTTTAAPATTTTTAPAPQETTTTTTTTVPAPATTTTTARPASEPEPEPAPAASTGGLQFTVHLASFTVQDNAQRAAAKLKEAGVPAFLTRIELGGTTYWRLMAGRFTSREAAESYGLKLQSQGKTQGLDGRFTVKPIVSAQ